MTASTATSATFTFSSDLAGGDVRVPPRPRPGRLHAVRVRRHLHRARPRRTPAGGPRQDAGGHGRPGAGRVRVADRRRHAADGEILTGPPQAPATTTDTTVTFTFTGDANGGSPLTFQCSLSGPVDGAAADLRRGHRLDQPDAARRRRVHVRADPGHAAPARRRRAGGVGVRRRRRDRPARRRSSTGPNVGPAPDLVSGPIAAFVFASDEADSTFECSFDATTWESCSATQEFSDLPPGETTLSVRAIDPSGNVDETPATKTWTVFGPPETTIDSAPPATTTEQTATFAFSSDQTGVTFECSLDGAVFVDCTSPVTYSDLARRPAHVRGPGHQRRRADRRDGGAARVGRRPAAGHDAADRPGRHRSAGDDDGDAGDVHVLGERAGGHVRVRRRRRRLRVVREPVRDRSEVEPGAHSLAVRATDSAGNVGPASALWDVDRRRPGRHDDHVRPARRDPRHDGDVRVQRQRGRRLVPVLARRAPPTRRARHRATYTGLGARLAHPAGAVGRQRRQRRAGAGRVELGHPRVRAAGGDDHRPPAGDDDRHDRRRSRSSPTSPARRSSARSTSAPTHRARRPRRTPTSASGPTCSPSRRSTRPATSRRRTRTRGRSRHPTRHRRCRASAAGLAARRSRPAPRSRSRRTRPA